MQNNFEKIGAENAIDSLAVIRPEEIYGAITGEFLSSIVSEPRCEECRKPLKKGGCVNVHCIDSVCYLDHMADH